MMKDKQHSDPDEVLTRLVDAIAQRDSFRSILINDAFDDWDLAKTFGGLLVRVVSAEAIGYASLARAHRHLGNSALALENLEQCRIRFKAYHAGPSAAELFFSFFAEEERKLSK